MEQTLFLRSLSLFASQWLIHLDPLLTQDAIYERIKNVHDVLYEMFCNRFHPTQKNITRYHERYTQWQSDDWIENLGKACIHSMVKTNFFLSAPSLPKCFRFDASFQKALPEELRKQAFPQIPFGLFYIFHENYFGFHIRFQDVARGGLRTVYVKKRHDAILLECYELAWTQEKKNKDIAEGGAKGVLFVNIPEKLMQGVVDEERNALLYEAQKGYVQGLISLVNGSDDGSLKEKMVVDYYNKPEHIYLGPDENMHDHMIEWIANYSKAVSYKPAGAFITGKSKAGINHKKYGVTSYGVTIFLDNVLSYLNLKGKPFSVKMMGGPDGDVAGNGILNLDTFYSDKVTLVAITDISGTVVDPEGISLAGLSALFYAAKPVSHYSADLLSSKGYMLLKNQGKAQIVKKGSIEEISAEQAQHISDHAVHEIEADIFIPAGGRPHSLDERTVSYFLNADKRPTSKAILEGANVYLTQKARDFLEELGVIIIRDSSANKGGVISSSYEVLASLVLSEEEFIGLKEKIAGEILQKIERYANQEAALILEVHAKTKKACSLISRDISDRILGATEEILDWLSDQELPKDIHDPLYKPFFAYCLPLLTSTYAERLMALVPENHKKAIIATYLSSQLVYKNYLTLPAKISSLIPDLIQQFTQ